MANVLIQRLTWRSLTPIILDNGLVIGAVAISAYLQLGWQAAAMAGDPAFLLKAALIAVVCQLCLYYADLYDSRAANGTEMVIRLLKSLGATSFVLAALYFLFPSLILGRGVFMLAALFVLMLFTCWRAGFGWMSERVGPRERLLFLGTKPAALNLARELTERRWELGVDIVGFVQSDDDLAPWMVPAPGVVGALPDIPEIVKRHGVDRVVVSLGERRGRLPMDVLLDMKLKGVRFDLLASVFEEYTGKIAIENLHPSWFVFSDGFRKSSMLLAAKRVVDVVASTIGLLIALPLMAAVALAVRLTSRGPALYHQTRTGHGGRPFTVHKFRTMRTDAEAKTGPTWAVAGDPRVTAIGGFLRRTRLDEIPQLWNVLRGDMSLVGPRPERPSFVEQLTEQIPFYGQRHCVRPGLTGWAQVRYTYGASVEDAMEKLQYDLFYIKNMSLMLDALVLFATVKTVILRRGGQ